MQILTNLVKVMMGLSSHGKYKVTMQDDRSIIEIYVYRLIIKSFIGGDQLNLELLQYLVKTFINLSRDKKFVYVSNILT